MTALNYATSPATPQGVARQPALVNGTASHETRLNQNRRLDVDNSLYRNRLTGQYRAPDRRSVRNLNKPAILQLLTVEKKPADFSWFKPPKVEPPEPFPPFDTTVYEPRFGDYWWAGDTNEYPFDTQYAPAVALTDPRRLLAASCVVVSSLTLPLVKAAEKKASEDVLLKVAPSADCLKHEPTIISHEHVTSGKPMSETMRLYHARWDNPNDKAAARAWNAHVMADIRAAHAEAKTFGAAARVRA